jgi:hypothetical protein
MQSHFDMLAEACVMKAEREKCEISGERSETYSSRNPVGSDGVPDGHARNGSRVMKSLPLH